jgi:ABC-type antimicrobial peptide transport system permease subunit
VRREVQGLDPDLGLQPPLTLRDAVRQATLPWRAAGMLAAGFGIVGLALAVLGIYGLVAYTFRQRTHEIGIRIALGAQRRDVFRLVLAQGLGLALAGVVLGAVIALGLTHALSELLFGIRASDELTYASVAVLLVVVTLAACWVPARRAAGIEPMAALRE